VVEQPVKAFIDLALEPVHDLDGVVDGGEPMNLSAQSRHRPTPRAPVSAERTSNGRRHYLRRSKLDASILSSRQTNERDKIWRSQGCEFALQVRASWRYWR
jgi:hypothetical protein